MKPGYLSSIFHYLQQYFISWCRSLGSYKPLPSVQSTSDIEHVRSSAIRLPNEIIALIAGKCVEPYNLKLRCYDYCDSHIFSLAIMSPRLTELRNVSPDFALGIQNSLKTSFNGHLVTYDCSWLCPVHFEPVSSAPWLVPAFLYERVTRLTMRRSWRETDCFDFVKFKHAKVIEVYDCSRPDPNLLWFLALLKYRQLLRGSRDQLVLDEAEDVRYLFWSQSGSSDNIPLPDGAKLLFKYLMVVDQWKAVEFVVDIGGRREEVKIIERKEATPGVADDIFDH